jgi:hypothetical protein
VKIVKLTESDLSRIVERVLAEQLVAPQGVQPISPELSGMDKLQDSLYKQRGAVKNSQGNWVFPCLKKLESMKIAGSKGKYDVLGTTYTFLKTGVYTREASTGKTQGTWKCDTQGFVELDGKEKLGVEKKQFQWKQAPTAQEVKTGKKILNFGMIGDFVATVQNKLKSVGINPGAIDKKFGQNTLKAVKDFQRKNGLKDDGLVGSKTYAAMFEVKPQAQPEQVGVTPVEKTNVQPKQMNLNVSTPKAQVQRTVATPSTGEIPTDNF